MKTMLMIGMLLVSTMTMADDNIRCEGQLVRVGEPVSKLLNKCGFPSYVDRYTGKNFSDMRDMYYPKPVSGVTYIITVNGSTIVGIRSER